MSNRRYVSYPKSMSDYAKKEGLRLISIDTPGITFQGPATIQEAAEVERFLLRWLRKRNKAKS